MKRIAILAAMPGELKPLVQGWQHESRAGVALWRKSSGDSEWIAACAGAGQQAATRAVAAIEQTGPLHAMVSVGWVGALGEEYIPGRSYRVAGVIDALTGERFEAATCPLPTQPFQNGTSEIWLVTSPRVADADEKRRLAGAYRAGLVDMEAAAVARLAAMRGIPFYAIKGVSDGFGDKLPDFNRFLAPSGEFRLTRSILFVIPRPWLWPALVRMGENSSKASCAMAKDLHDLLGC